MLFLQKTASNEENSDWCIKENWVLYLYDFPFNTLEIVEIEYPVFFDTSISYARRLMQSTLKEGKRSYQEKVPLLYDLPYMIMACSVLMIITVICLTKLLSNTLIAPMVKLAHSSREIARNDFGGEDLVVENRDEMGELVQAFNKMKSEK